MLYPVVLSLKHHILTLLQAAASKTSSSGSQGDISTKQAGLSSTNTRHSTDITKDPEMSKKGEGVPDTAKVSGTVSVNRPTVSFSSIIAASCDKLANN
jgi:hypothetical protein